MSLFCAHTDKLQNEVGKKEHWRGFEKFENSQMHILIVEKLDILINDADDEKVLNSRFDGNKILDQISKEEPDVYKKHNENLLGSLFGMTMWNYIAKAESSWYFNLQQGTHEDQEGCTRYFRKKS